MKNINIGITNLSIYDKLNESNLDNNLIEDFKKTSSNYLGVIKNSPMLQLEFKVTDYKLLTQPLLKSKRSKKLWPGGDVYILIAKKSIISVTPLVTKTTPQKKTISATVSPCIKPTNRV